MSTTPEGSRVAVNNESYDRVKATADKFFTTLRQARNNENEGKMNLVSTYKLSPIYLYNLL